MTKMHFALLLYSGLVILGIVVAFYALYTASEEEDEATPD